MVSHGEHAVVADVTGEGDEDSFFGAEALGRELGDAVAEVHAFNEMTESFGAGDAVLVPLCFKGELERRS